MPANFVVRTFSGHCNWEMGGRAGTSYGGNIGCFGGDQSKNTLKSERASPHALKISAMEPLLVELKIVRNTGYSYSSQYSADKPWVRIFPVEK